MLVCRSTIKTRESCGENKENNDKIRLETISVNAILSVAIYELIMKGGEQ